MQHRISTQFKRRSLVAHVSTVHLSKIATFTLNFSLKFDTQQERRRKRELARVGDHEVCRNTFQLSSEAAVYTHKRSGEIVPLYTYHGAVGSNYSYHQVFKLARCIQNMLTTLEIRGLTFACKETYTDVLATIVVRNKQMLLGRFNNCHPVGNYFICHDWILVPTHCKLYFRSVAEDVPQTETNHTETPITRTSNNDG